MRDALDEFIRASFTAANFRRWIRGLSPGEKDVAQELPGGSESDRALYDAGIGILIQQGLVDGQLFDSLAREFPRKIADITRLAERCGVGWEPPRVVAVKQPPIDDGNNWGPVAAVLLGSVLAIGLIVFAFSSPKNGPTVPVEPVTVHPTLPLVNPATVAEPDSSPPVAPPETPDRGHPEALPPSIPEKPGKKKKTDEPAPVTTSSGTPSPSEKDEKLDVALAAITSGCIPEFEAVTLTLACRGSSLSMSPEPPKNDVARTCIRDRLSGASTQILGLLNGRRWTRVSVEFTHESATLLKYVESPPGTP